MAETFKSPFDLIASVKRSRGEDVGPPPFGYSENRSLEAPEGPSLSQPAILAVFPDDPVATVPIQPVPIPPPPPVEFQPATTAPHFLRGDYVQLNSLSAHLDKYDCRISEADAKAIRAILLKAIRREIRALEKGA